MFYEKESVEAVVNECIDNNILKDFLEKNNSEVIDMVLYEFNLNAAIEASSIHGKENGVKEGIKQGKEEGKKKALREIAFNMKDFGMSPKKVMEITSLDLEEVEGIFWIYNFETHIKALYEEGFEEGIQEGIKQGNEEGFHETLIEMSKKMKDTGYSLNEIYNFTGLDRRKFEL